MFITSWNMGDSELPQYSNNVWLKDSYGCDIIAIGLQEAKTNNAFKKIKSNFQKDYEIIEYLTLWNIGLIVFIKKELFKFVILENKLIKPLGFANILGNKGILLISFKLFNKKFVITNSHLAAGPGNKKNNLRINNLIEIFKNFKFNDIDFLNYHDFSFFIGDLNFRINNSFDPTLEKIKNQNYIGLLNEDQLSILKNKNIFFSQMKEGKIFFKPTYRRKRNDNNEYSNKNNQSPSYTDRILYFDKYEDSINQIYYNSVEDQYSSDHKPINSIFDIKLNFNEHFLNLKDFQDDGLLYLIFKEIHIDINFEFLETFFPNYISNMNSFKIKLDFSLNPFIINKCVSDSYQYILNSKKKIRWNKKELPNIKLINMNLNDYFSKNFSIKIIIYNKNFTEAIGVSNFTLNYKEVYNIKENKIYFNSINIGDIFIKYKFEKLN